MLNMLMNLKRGDVVESTHRVQSLCLAGSILPRTGRRDALGYFRPKSYDSMRMRVTYINIDQLLLTHNTTTLRQPVNFHLQIE